MALYTLDQESGLPLLAATAPAYYAPTQAAPQSYTGIVVASLSLMAVVALSAATGATPTALFAATTTTTTMRPTMQATWSNTPQPGSVRATVMHAHDPAAAAAGADARARAPKWGTVDPAAPTGVQAEAGKLGDFSRWAMATAGMLVFTVVTAVVRTMRGPPRNSPPTMAMTALVSERVEDMSAPIDAPAKKEKRKQLALKIDGDWYDCTGWALAHPAGARFVEFFHGRDATDVFYALHSTGPNGDDLALRSLQKLRKIDAPVGALDNVDAETAAACDSFRDLRVKLEQEGWFERDPIMEALSLANVLGLCALGTFFAWTAHPFAAVLLLGVGMQQAGWLGHDYIHGRGKWCSTMRALGGYINGHGVDWWTQKHSMHHSFTNEEGKDEDVMQEPFFFLRPPSESGRADGSVRKWQHIYGYPLYAFTFVLWRFDSIRDVLKRKDVKTGAILALNYAWLATMPLAVSVGSVLLSGFLCGALVSATHQSEEIMEEQGEFVDVQFRSTRDADAENAVFKYLWGGMDTQLEHHLFPTMPRYRYHKLRPLLQAWAKAHGHHYRISPGIKIVQDNWRQLRDVAMSPVHP